MAEDTSQQDFRDSDRVSGAQECEIGYFASKFGLSLAQIREFIANMAMIARHWSAKQTRSGHDSSSQIRLVAS
jgi:hypothetical protein